MLLIDWQFDIFWKNEIIILFGKESSGGDCRASQRPTPFPLHLLPDRSHANAGTWDNLFRRTLDRSYPQEPPAVHLNKYRKTHRVYQKYLQEHPQQIYRAATITVREERVCSNPWSLIVLNCTLTGFRYWCEQSCGRPEGKRLVRQLNNRLFHG